MKNLLTRLREWLIRKLGGYTYPPDIKTPVVIKTIRPVRVTAACTIRRLDIKQQILYSDAAQRAKDQVAADILKAMLRDGCITFSSYAMSSTGDVVVRGTVLLYPENEREVACADDHD
mgnify:CR=1 FL=1